MNASTPSACRAQGRPLAWALSFGPGPGTQMSIVRYEHGRGISQVIAHDTTAYLAAQTAPDTQGGVYGQTQEILKRIDSLLAHCGSDKMRLLSVTIILADITTHAEMLKAWEEWAPPDESPAFSAFAATLPDPRARVSISTIAARFHHA